MRSKLTYRLFFLLLAMAKGIYAQNDWSNFRSKKINLSTDTIFLDSLSIVPGSLRFSEDKSCLSVDYLNGLLLNQCEGGDSVEVFFRVFPVSFGEKHFSKNTKINRLDHPQLLKTYELEKRKFNLKTEENSGLELQKNGSISRGITFGNNQDLAVNSSLNLQIAGKLSDEVGVLASISDDNIPIQPDGNTQQLQDFDQIYIQVFNENNKLTMGDFQLKNNENYFLKYFKKAQGLTLSSTYTPFDIQKKNSGKTEISAALSRGKFSRNVIQGVEGNQGPYRLKGAENETFVIVLSGTERVFIDGELLVRGQDQDYIIDYNTAELSFTPKRLITKDKRIVVEFQYSDRNYARSIYQTHNEFRWENSKVWLSFYSEQDLKNQPLQQELSDEQKFLLRTIGDSLDLAVSTGATKTDFSENAVMYKMEVSETGDTIFIFSTSPDSAIYRVSFSLVGQGNGSYFQQRTTVNGKIYQYIGEGLGDYEPVILLATPKKKQVFLIGGEWKDKKGGGVSTELAVSNHDINTFSTNGNSDNSGLALKSQAKKRIWKGKNEEKKWALHAGINYEYISKTFSTIERFRSVEFERDWNVKDLILSNDQHMVSAQVILSNPAPFKALYDVSSFFVKNQTEGIKHSTDLTYLQKGWNIDIKSSVLNSTNTFRTTEFYRAKSTLSKEVWKVKVGVKEDFEQNLFTDLLTSSAMNNSYQFVEWQTFLEGNDSLKNNFQLSYGERGDAGISSNAFKQATKGKNLSFGLDLLKNSKSSLKTKTTYRILSINDPSLTTQTADSTLLDRLEYTLKLFKGAIQSYSFYEAGSGLEVKKEFTFIEVSNGQGVYAWRDYNENGLKEINEFEIALYQDQANYIKIFTPTNQYVKTYSNQFNQTVNIQPKAIWHNKTGVRALLARFSNQFSFRTERKTMQSQRFDAYNPFLQNVADSHLIALNTSYRNTLFFNKSNPVFGVDYTYSDNRNKNLLTTGFDSKALKSNEVNLRINASKTVMINLEAKTGRKSSLSDVMTNRNFDIVFNTIGPKITYQNGSKYRFSFFSEYSQKINNYSDLGEAAVVFKAGPEYAFSLPEKGIVNASITYISIVYDGATNTSLGYEMLESLQPGDNLNWQLNFQRTLANNLQLSINYTGRKSEKNKAIHTGGVQVRAFF